MKAGNRVQLILLLLLLSIPMTRADGIDVLDRIIQLPKMKGTIYTLLNKVTEQTGYLFIYDSKLINNDSSVKIQKQSCSVRQAIYEIIGDKSLELKVMGNHILIVPFIDKQKIEKETVVSPLTFFTATGTLLDKETGLAVPNVSVMVRGTSIGSITNQNGEFKLHLPDSLKQALVAFSHIGYVTQEVEASALAERSYILSLSPKIVPLQEVLIRWVDPRKRLKEMIERRSENYSASSVYLTTFYREGVQVNTKFQNLTEAVFKIYKPSWSNPLATEQVKLLKMSRINNRDRKDSIYAKIRAGIDACIKLDLIKDLPDFLSFGMDDNYYVYSYAGMTYIDNRSVDIINFEQKRTIKFPLYCGELYIDSENGALIQARIEVQPEFIKAATGIFVLKQTPNIKLTTQKVVYTISYRPWNGVYYIHHVRGDLLFRARRKHALFSSSTVRTWFEMVTCKIDDENVTRFSRTDRLPTRSVFEDTEFMYDESFWGDFNVIPWEEELSKIIEKVSLKIEKIEERRSGLAE